MIKKSTWLFFLVMVALLIVAGCSGGEPKTYTSPDNIISVKANRVFTIALKANPTTGFAWEATFDQLMLQLVSQNYIPDEHEEGMVGVGGTDYLHFNALSTGSAEIELTYSQPWVEEEGEYDQHLTFKVEIK